MRGFLRGATVLLVMALVWIAWEGRTAHGRDLKAQENTPYKPIVSIGGEALERDDFFSSIVDLHLDESNDIHVMDGQERRLSVFDLKGKLKARFALPKGEGPGEYSKPKCFAYDGSRYAIGDMNLKRITLVDQSGKYLSGFRVDEQPGRIQIYQGRLYLSGVFDYSKDRVHVYDLETKKKIASNARRTR